MLTSVVTEREAAALSSRSVMNNLKETELLRLHRVTPESGSKGWRSGFRESGLRIQLFLLSSSLYCGDDDRSVLSAEPQSSSFCSAPVSTAVMTRGAFFLLNLSPVRSAQLQSLLR
ncbi:hypothetical protein WMY93_006797 [Mugilogobius chulae]|uniref:Uncharacterized protein n=1 Tax=Mugilogobius chulae TaxID=88201 RepID=A0AAW0PNG1_9GOBI